MEGIYNEITLNRALYLYIKAYVTLMYCMYNVLLVSAAMCHFVLKTFYLQQVYIVVSLLLIQYLPVGMCSLELCIK